MLTNAQKLMLLHSGANETMLRQGQMYYQVWPLGAASNSAFNQCADMLIWFSPLIIKGNGAWKLTHHSFQLWSHSPPSLFQPILQIVSHDCARIYFFPPWAAVNQPECYWHNNASANTLRTRSLKQIQWNPAVRDYTLPQTDPVWERAHRLFLIGGISEFWSRVGGVEGLKRGRENSD